MVVAVIAGMTEGLSEKVFRGDARKLDARSDETGKLFQMVKADLRNGRLG